jgi:hypothetical protein
MSLIVALAGAAFVFWGAVYFVFFQANASPVADLLWGKRVPLPQEPGVWIATEDQRSGAVREERLLLEAGFWGQTVVRQVRWRAAADGEIVQVDAETRTRRPRIGRGARRG